MKVTYIISNIDYALEFDWIATGLQRAGFDLQFIFLNQKPGALHQKLLEKGISSIELLYSSKKELPALVFKVRRELRKFKPQLVHTHLFEGSLVGLLAAKLAGVKQRIYTRHHSNYHHVYAPQAVKFDKLINRWSTGIISISAVVTEVFTQLEHVSPEKITLIEHGINPANFQPSSPREIADMRAKYQLRPEDYVIGCISRFDKWKGVNYILDAFAVFHQNHPEAVLLLAYGGGGDDQQAILQQIEKQHLSEFIRLIPFEKKVNTLYDCMDVFVHTPIDRLVEAFGQIYVEAMYKKVPLIATKSGVGNKLVTAPENTVDYQNPQALVEKLELHYAMEPAKKQALLEKNYAAVAEYYTFDRKEKQIVDYYLKLA